MIGEQPVATTDATICLGVWWQSNLSAARSVPENTAKARKAFFALGSIGAFSGELNPLSTSSIFETCVVPKLLYGCETWLLDTTCLKKLEQFQHEIGRRILRLSKYHSGDAVCIGLHWPSMATRILLRKLKFMGRLLDPSHSDTVSSRVFTTMAIEDIYISIVQQCRIIKGSNHES